MESSLELRATCDDDLPFLRRVYASTREEELTPVPWSAAEKDAFLAMQFAAQHAHYHRRYTETSFSVIALDGEPIGRLYVARWTAEMRIVDISLLPAFRAQGVGRRLIEQILEEARAAGKPVTIHVEKFNPAQRLYRRLGFRPTNDAGVYQLWEWSPVPHFSDHGDCHAEPPFNPAKEELSHA